VNNYPFTPGVKTERPETSRQAASKMESKAATLRERCFRLLQGDSYTADEIAAALGEDRLAIRPRISELVAMGKIEDSGRRHKNESGARAAVWQLAKPKTLRQVNLFESL
jgi:predicted ArsR family transcriptional regulator